MAADEPRHRHMVRNQVARDHPKRDVLTAVTLDRPRRAHTRSQTQTRSPSPSSMAHTQQPRDHRPDRPHRTPKVHALHGVDHEPRQVIRRQPIPHVRRQQKPLLSTALNEVLRHTEIVLNAPDGPAFMKQPPSAPEATGVDAGGCSAMRAVARCACRSRRIGSPASTSTTPATAAKHGRGPVARTPGVAGDAVGCANGDEQVAQGWGSRDPLRPWGGSSRMAAPVASSFRGLSSA